MKGSYGSAPHLDFAGGVPPTKFIIMKEKQTLFFHKYSFDKEGKPLMSFICKTACIERNKIEFNGITGLMRSTESVDAHFVLCIITDSTGKAVDPRNFEFDKDQPVPGIMDSGKPVTAKDGTVTSLTWGCVVPTQPAVKE